MRRLLIIVALLALASVASPQDAQLVTGRTPGLVVSGRAFQVIGVNLACFQKLSLGAPTCVESDLLPEWSVVRCFPTPPHMRTDWQPTCVSVPFAQSSSGLGVAFYVRKAGLYHVTARTTAGELEVRVSIRR